jgi:OPA family sugar phosphate sensor protein UhpC-like MFS transporter
MGLPTVADWRDDHYAGSRDAHAPPGGSVLRQQFAVLAIPAIWVLAVSSALMYVTRYAINSWGVLYLQEARGYSLVEAGGFLMASTLAGVLGCVAFGFISDKAFGARRPPANLLFALIEIAGLALIFFGPHGHGWLTLAFVLYGVGLNGLVTSLGGLFAVDIAPKRVAGAVMGVVGIMSYLGAALQENLSGYLIERGMTVADGVRSYDFGPAITLWIGTSVVSMLLVASLWRVRLRD